MPVVKLWNLAYCRAVRKCTDRRRRNRYHKSVTTEKCYVYYDYWLTPACTSPPNEATWHLSVPALPVYYVVMGVVRSIRVK